MRVVLQRVLGVKLYVEGKLYSETGSGLLVFACICRDDTDNDLRYVARKVVNMRIFADENNRFNLSLLDVKGECMIVSQFTLAADTLKGNRPSYFYAMPPDEASQMYERFKGMVSDYGVRVKSGMFGAMMRLEIINDGPVTIYMDSKEHARMKGSLK